MFDILLNSPPLCIFCIHLEQLFSTRCIVNCFQILSQILSNQAERKEARVTVHIKLFLVPYYESISTEPRSRFRRSIEEPDQDEPFSFTLFAFGVELKLNLTVNKNLIANSHVIEFHNADGTIEKYGGLTGEFSTGSVEDDPESFVALHRNSRGIVSIYSVFNTTFKFV